VDLVTSRDASRTRPYRVTWRVTFHAGTAPLTVAKIGDSATCNRAEVRIAFGVLVAMLAIDSATRIQRPTALQCWPAERSTLTLRDLPTGEYSFRPSNSNDGYCFGVDPVPGQ
jgi:hypothetical protein